MVRTNKETGAVEKTNDMDYEDYMNIINRVRKTKEFTRVRTEQARLASMYAQVRTFCGIHIVFSCLNALQ